MTNTNTNTTDTRATRDHAENTSVPGTVPSPGEDQEGAAGTDPAMTAEEIGGPKGPEPTRYGDWEKKGRCIDF